MATPTPATSPPSRGPDTLLILLAVAVVLAIVVPWLPAGVFLQGQPVSLESFRAAGTGIPVRWFASGDGPGLLNVLFDGLTSGDRNGAAVGVIAFVLIVGGAFGVVQAGGAVDRGLERMIAMTGDRPRLLLSLLFVAFSLGGAVFGMGEETIAFLALLLPLVRRLGYPPEIAVMATYLASQIGFGSSWMNPFSVAVAQGIAGVPLLSGAGLRMAMWAVMTAAGLAFMLRYAARHRRDSDVGMPPAAGPHPLGAGDRVVLLAVLATVAWIVWGVVAGGYYIAEIASQFFALGVFAGVVAVVSGRLGANQATAAFVDGMRQLVPCAVVIALAKGILGLMGGADPHQPSVLNTLLFTLGSALQHTPELWAAEGMLLVQALINVFVTSGSAQAAITMPLMAGLGDLLGVSRQTAVLAFQLGDGLTNLVVPTSAAMMGAIGVAGLGWTDWLRIIWRLEVALLGLGMLFVALAVLTGYH
ncbi:putative basic amino acid antiporter YfcC [Marilutibacter aestuarii]|uniref:Putative basic amino acid antiporter YfcC n=1 Tax=Marilutibacter aestuarii TaxID=1706195 RepID=A0A507ZWL3_9GAMM|nr:putative basic amino acid antiporter YfcC [Lysobacter aestuarii]TQD40873.1 putative basic amino acid antiporter YfcC [Lysobacter aestuarii]